MALIVALAALTLAAGCGDAGGGEGSGAAAADEAVHVHGLGINPADGALYIAAHTGLFRMQPGAGTAERVGDRHQDTMGFTVVGPNHFLGSGHPDLRDDLPPLLGLIESTDGGRTWRSVSLLGTADFHVLRADGEHVLGYDVARGSILRSRDGGHTWTGAPPPVALTDVVAHPDDPDHLVAAGADGLIGSRNGGRTWRTLQGSAVALAWPAPEALYAFAEDGGVRVSRDGGGTWTELDALPGSPAAVTAPDRDTLVVALHDGGFVSSADGGRRWSSGAWPG